MKHAGPDTLKRLGGLLQELRKRTAMKERTPGSFYLRSKAFLHFHDDPAGLFADLKEGERDFVRYRVSTQAEQAKLLARVDHCLKKFA